jgi:uncharacterized protein YbcC (UPF0753/DUF2309 family)
MRSMSRVQTIAMLTVLFAPAIAQACPAAAAAECGSCGGASLLTYIVLFGGGLIAGIGSIALRRG